MKQAEPHAVLFGFILPPAEERGQREPEPDQPGQVRQQAGHPVPVVPALYTHWVVFQPGGQSDVVSQIKDLAMRPHAVGAW